MKSLFNAAARRLSGRGDPTPLHQTQAPQTPGSRRVGFAPVAPPMASDAYASRDSGPVNLSPAFQGSTLLALAKRHGISQASDPSNPPPRREAPSIAAPASKDPVPDFVPADHGFTDDIRLSLLKTSTGRQYYLLSSGGQGSYKKFRLACDAARGTVYADTEYRLNAKEGQNKHGKHRTVPTAMTALVRGCARLQRFTPIQIEEIGIVVRGTQRSCLQRKVHVLQTLMTGGDARALVDLMSEVWQGHAYTQRRGAVGLFVAAELAKQIEKLHDKRRIHRDIKLANTLVHEDGNIALADTDLVRPLEKNGLYARRTHAGTYLPAEMLAGEHYGRPVDVWMYGVTVASAFVPEHPFAHDTFDAAYYEQWYNGLWRGHELDLSRLDGDRSPFGIYFQKLRAVQGELCAYVLKSLLAPWPEDRTTITQAREQMDAWLGDDTTRLARDTLETLVQRTPLTSLKRRLVAYQAAHPLPPRAPRSGHDATFLESCGVDTTLALGVG
jgi:serine/threonine protein kinase